MNEKQKEFLAQSGINLTDGLAYFSENERLYEKYLFRFLEEPTFPELFKAIEEDRREDARRAAHSLKGITATLGFTSLHTPLKAQEFEFKNGRWEEGNQYTDELKFSKRQRLWQIEQNVCAFPRRQSAGRAD